MTEIRVSFNGFSMSCFWSYNFKQKVNSLIDVRAVQNFFPELFFFVAIFAKSDADSKEQ